MLVTGLAAGLEALLVLCWIMGFADSIGTPHQHWYLELPSAFLFVPLAVGLSIAKVRRWDENRRCTVYFVAFVLLFLNLITFGMYAMFSGGGV